MIEALDEAQGHRTPKLTVEESQKKLFKKVDLSSLDSWSPGLAESAGLLLAEYHDISLLSLANLVVLTILNMQLMLPMMPL